MKPFDKLFRQIDYNNTYTIKKAVSILTSEFKTALENKDIQYANDIFNAVKHIYDILSSSYKESSDYSSTMSYLQMVWAKRLRDTLNFMHNTIKTQVP